MKTKISEFEKHQEWTEHLMTEVLKNATGDTALGRLFDMFRGRVIKMEESGSSWLTCVLKSITVRLRAASSSHRMRYLALNSCAM